MPKRKEPASLQKIALDLLLDHIVHYCDKLSATGSLEKLRQGISAIKQDVCQRIVWHFSPEFCARFLDEFASKKRPEWQYQAALEIIMDVEIIGLRCDGPILEYLDPHDGHRFRRLVELDLSHFSTGVYSTRFISLEDFHLNHLTTFIFPHICSDLHLTVIGQNCAKLQALKIPHANYVTDAGLRALSSCCELRVVDINSCQGVTHVGVGHLLSEHAKLEDFSYGQAEFDNAILDETDFLSHLDTVVQCPSMKSFSINSAYVTDAHVRSMVAKFPNLNHLSILDGNVHDLSALKDFRKLHGIALNLTSVDSSFGMERAVWGCLKELLIFVGGNIRTLKLSNMDRGFFLKQDGLNFIFQSCPNIEHLMFDHGYEDLVIPPFQKLKDLSISVRRVGFDLFDAFDRNTTVQLLRFCKMLNLEALALNNFGVDLESVKSIMLDHRRFPNLTELRIDSLTIDEVEIERIARSNNLDFSMLNRGYRPHVRTRVELV